MPNKHKNPTLCWHPPAELSARARALAARLGVPLRAVLDAALADYLDKHDPHNDSRERDR